MIPDVALAAVLGLGALALLFVPLEHAFPAWRAQPRLRPALATDLAFLLGQHLVFSALTIAVLDAVLAPLREASPMRPWFTALPIVLQAIVALALGDLLLYWMHRWQHTNAFLWRFHGVHHTAERLDFVAAHREHPIDGIITRLVVNLPAAALGMSWLGLFGLLTFRGLWATFIHANVAIPLGPLQLLFGSPQLHHWHHARDRLAGNYANLAPWIDRLFGTYRCAPAPPPSLGTDEPWPRSYLGLLLHPLRRRDQR